ncbi:hypothetical protein SeMB42_g04122 [Synchytrium endobioticum]|uniref:Uncharacterized protein n=1 Tax=Synchytrium endobioticum TaxID=286115 RepID=A0A507D107_9FUNG|nr:hypothetical protein SeMB42_g04124 [Synchytrium endobioticum]TPX45069.1 hypothetical protein SeMB42_g04122 [Synchytrium endobioticum]
MHSFRQKPLKHIEKLTKRLHQQLELATAPGNAACLSDKCLQRRNEGRIIRLRPRTLISPPLALRQELEPVVKAYCRLTRFEPLHMDADHQPINYLATSIVTNLKVNVQEHFMQFSLDPNIRAANSLFVAIDVPDAEEASRRVAEWDESQSG